MAPTVSPAFRSRAAVRMASLADMYSAGARIWRGASRARPGAASRSAPSAIKVALDIRIALFFFCAARVGDGPVLRRADGLRVFPEVARAEFSLASGPCLAALVELGVRDLDLDGALDGVDGDNVAVPDEADGAADRRLRTHVADAEAARRAGEAPVRDERDLVAHALAVERRRGGQHLAHARAAARSLV